MVSPADLATITVWKLEGRLARCRRCGGTTWRRFHHASLQFSLVCVNEATETPTGQRGIELHDLLAARTFVEINPGQFVVCRE